MSVLKTKITKLDKSTGEIVEVEKHFAIKVKNNEHFFSSFINSVGRLYNLKNVSDYKVIIELCCHAEYNTGVIHMSSHLRKQIIDKLGLSTQNFSNSISRLKELKLISGENGSFLINPEIFWIGDRETRLKLLVSEQFEIVFKIKNDE